MGKILKFPGRREKPVQYEEFDIMVTDPEGGPHKFMKLQVNNILFRDAPDAVKPIILLNGIDITSRIHAIISCDIDPFGDCWTNHAAIFTADGIITMQGIKWRDQEVPYGFSGALLPVWHFQRAADLNNEYGRPPEEVLAAAPTVLKEVKEYCDYVFSGEKRVYEENASLSTFR